MEKCRECDYEKNVRFVEKKWQTVCSNVKCKDYKKVKK